MPDISTSIIIPVHDNWDLTESCLKSLAATTGENAEIIVVDNASSDRTPSACPELGRSLFGDAFSYVRNDLNRNFAGASNQGAQAANGRFLVFLNNDTEVTQGWLSPLLSDFDEFPNLAATGPILAYPASGPLGLSVQHLGVVFNPWLRVSHLYKGIPLASPLARKRRFFQAITGACMVMPRALFLEAGGFDELFINGYEDIDLCAKLWDRGYRFTVNPESLVLHYESRTQGRSAHEGANSDRLEKGNLCLFVPDWHLKIREDGLIPKITLFGVPRAAHPDRLSLDLDARAQSMKPEALAASIKRFPLWEGGWRTLLSRTRDIGDRVPLFQEMIQVFPTPENNLTGCGVAMRTNNVELLGKCVTSIRDSIDSPESILHKVQDNREWCADLGLTELADAYGAWLRQYPAFKSRIYPEFASEFLKMASRVGMQMSPANAGFYNLWLNRPKEASEPWVPQGTGLAFSILMPVYNPDPGYFRQALDSVIAQTWPAWELCVADDASPNPEIRKIINEYAAKDSRIKAVFRKRNGHIAAATNSALKISEKPWTAFMDHDDELAPDALEKMARAIEANPQGMLFYSDEDKITEYGHHNRPHLKSGWDPDLFLHQNFVCHLTVMKADHLREIGGLKTDYPGAQDHELILRYTEGIPEGSIIHVPEILYHWREHNASTARSLDAKDYAQDSAVRAVQAHLDRTIPGARAARMEDDLWTRVKLPVPEIRPIASIIIPWPPFPGYRRFLEARTSYPFEIVDSAADASGEILAFLEPALLPWTTDWLEELVSCLCRDDVGAVGGSLIGYDGKQIHAGYLADSQRKLKPIFTNAIREPYIGWLDLPRTVDTVDGLCLLTRKADFEGMGGLSAEMGSWAFQDYCLRLGEKGLRTVWHPFARFIASKEIRLSDAPDAFHEKWHPRAFNRNLKIVDQGFALDAGTLDVRAR